MSRIALETNCRYVTRAGSARYVDGLIGGLRMIRPKGMEFFELAWAVENLGYRQPLRALKTVYRELIWSRSAAPRELARQQAALLHRCSLAVEIATPPGVPEVVTLHDVAPLRHPERFRRWHRTTATRRLFNLRRADRVICSSRFTADEAHKLLDIPIERLEVVYLGNSLDGGAATPAESRPHVDVPERFFLFVGTLEPGKNLPLLSAAYALAAANHLDLPPLVVVGERWAGVAGEGPPPASWRYTGRLPDEALAWLYRHAIALMFPSQYEGFGLPVVEAMSFGCPVVCSRVASLPEVGGDAVHFSDITPQAYLAAMQLLATDDAAREQLAASGMRQAARFSWTACAAATADIYRSVLRC